MNTMCPPMREELVPSELPEDLQTSFFLLLVPKPWSCPPSASSRTKKEVQKHSLGFLTPTEIQKAIRFLLFSALFSRLQLDLSAPHFQIRSFSSPKDFALYILFFFFLPFRKTKISFSNIMIIKQISVKLNL